jgi:hypothetical protein
VFPAFSQAGVGFDFGIGGRLWNPILRRAPGEIERIQWTIQGVGSGVVTLGAVFKLRMSARMLRLFPLPELVIVAVLAAIIFGPRTLWHLRQRNRSN